MNKILFPTEFSAHAPQVFRYALELAQKLNAQIIALHAFGRPQHPMEAHKDLEERTKEVLKSLKKFVDKNRPASHLAIKVDCMAKVDYPGDAILETALKEEVDLIVMGMTGKTNSLESLFGSTTLSILAKADCPVMAVPASCQFKLFERMVYATNFEFRDLEAINILRHWAKAFDAQIRCLHVVENDEDELSVLRSMNILRHTFHGKKMIAFDLVKGDLQKEMKEYIREQQADLLALLSHKRGFVSRLLEGSTAIDMAKRIQIPLLVMKDNSYELPKPMDWGAVISIG